jgi:hypothetical protein
MTKKDHNFWSDRWITLKFLQEFLDAAFLQVYYGIVTPTVRSLDIQNIIPRPCFGSFMIFLVIFEFVYQSVLDMLRSKLQ